ncbi:MAG: Ig-like domain-containing protein [Candidatus Kapaibacterium sp.]
MNRFRPRLAELLRSFLPFRETVQFLIVVAAAPLLSILCSCASGQGTPPPGGPADSIPPAVISTIPGNGTLNFHEKSIFVEFSERLEESNIAQSIVITPIPAEPPVLDWTGTTLEIAFRKPLLENRTYAITFGSGITDLARNRLGTPFTLRFATGDRIDSGRIQGRVINSSKVRAKAFVFAYLIPADSARFSDTLRPDSVRPDFIGPVGDDGTFSLEGLPTGNFRLLAVVDDAGDQIFTPGQDAFGLPIGDVRVVSAEKPVTGVAIRLRPAADDMTPPALYSASSIARTRSEIRFSEPIDTAVILSRNFELTAAGAAVPISAAYRSAVNRLAVQLIHPPLAAGAEATIHTLNLRDTVGNLMPDSSSTGKFTVTGGLDTLPPALLPLEIDSAHAYTFPDSIRLRFDKGVVATNLEGAVSLRDTAGPRAAFRTTMISPVELIARPIDTLYGAARGVVEISLGRFTDMAGNRRDSIVKVMVPIGQTRQNGTLQGSITDSAAPGALHVVVARGTTNGAEYRKRGIKAGLWEFTGLPEGEYDISAFRDSDGNGEYNYGSAIPYRPAELYVAWSGSVRVRPRWITNKIDLIFR